VAFRYLIPPSALLLDLLIEDEASEFRLAQDAAEAPAGAGSLAITWSRKPGMAWLGITRSRVQRSRRYLVRERPTTMIAAAQKPNIRGGCRRTPWNQSCG